MIPGNCVAWTRLCLRRESREMAWGFRLAGGLQEATKLFVTRVTPGSPAALAGLQKGDTIELIDNYRGSDLTYSDAMQLLQRNGTAMTLEIVPANSCSREFSSTDLNSMLSSGSPRHSRNTSLIQADDCLSPSSSVVNLLHTHNPAPMTAWSTAQPAFRRVNSQEARISPMLTGPAASGAMEETPAVGSCNQLGQAVRRRNASSLARSPGYHSYVKQLQQPLTGGISAWDPPNPLRRSSSAATLPHSFRTGSQYGLFHQPPQHQQQQPQQQQVPDKLLNLYYQAGPQDKKPFSYAADNQQLERELQDAFMRRRRSRPRYRSTSTEVGYQQPLHQQPQQQQQQQQTPAYASQPYYERSSSVVTQDRAGYNQNEATKRCANDITRYFAEQTAQLTADEAYWSRPQSSNCGISGGSGGIGVGEMSLSNHQQLQPPHQQLKFPAKQERKVSTSSVTLSCQGSGLGQFNARNQPQQQQQQQQSSPAQPASGNHSFRVLQWLSNSSEMQNSSVRDEVQQKLSRAGVKHPTMPTVAPPMSPGVSYYNNNNHHQPQPSRQQMAHQQQQQQQYFTQPRNPARLSSSVSDLPSYTGGGQGYQRLNSAINSPITSNRGASTMGRSRQRQQLQNRQDNDPFEAIRATIRANQQAREQQQAATDPSRTYRLEKNAVREKPDELAHNAKFQRIREKMLQQPSSLTDNDASGGLDDDRQSSEVLREDRVDSAARVQELKQIQLQFNRQTISNDESSIKEHEKQQSSGHQEHISSQGLTEF